MRKKNLLLSEHHTNKKELGEETKETVPFHTADNDTDIGWEVMNASLSISLSLSWCLREKQMKQQISPCLSFDLCSYIIRVKGHNTLPFRTLSFLGKDRDVIPCITRLASCISHSIFLWWPDRRTRRGCETRRKGDKTETDTQRTHLPDLSSFHPSFSLLRIQTSVLLLKCHSRHKRIDRGHKHRKSRSEIKKAKSYQLLASREKEMIIIMNPHLFLQFL